MMKVLAFDIDGTLTNSRKEITPATKAAIRRAAELGCKIVIASGRPPQGVRRYVKELDLEELGGYVLCMNGGKIISCADGRVLRDCLIPEEYNAEIIELAAAEDVHILTYEGDNILSETPEDPYLEIEARINGLGVKPVESLLDYVSFPVNKYLMLGDGDRLAEVEKRVWELLHERLDVYRSEPFFLEILPKGINKADALETLLQEVGANREELMAFGDGFNDLTMIRYAGIGVAMGNAVEVVKEAADVIVPTNDEDGIVTALERYVFSET